MKRKQSAAFDSAGTVTCVLTPKCDSVEAAGKCLMGNK